jgi:lipoyl(octanoyl) transferase
MSQTSVLIRHLGLVPYLPVYQAMQTFTDTRQPDTPDEFWLLQHFPVYTLGQAGLPEHLLQTGDIPVYHIDRGGQVTYHGPGQLIAYIFNGFKTQSLGSQSISRSLGTRHYRLSRQLLNYRRTATRCPRRLC